GAVRPQGPATAFPGLGSRGAGAPANSDFGGGDWRAKDAVLEKIDLAQNLPPYPHQAAAGGAPLAGMNGYHDRFDAPAGANPMQTAAIQAQFVQAQTARQTLARQIYDRLLYVTGTPQPANPAAPTDPELQPRRYLAQIAVNIVDYIDEDEIST